jgi:tight adherence protein B
VDEGGNLKSNLDSLLTRAGIRTLNSAQFILLVITGFTLLLGIIYLLTNSIQIALSTGTCLFAQLVDSFRNRIRAEQLRQNQDWPKYLDSIHSAAWAGKSLSQAISDSRAYAPKSMTWAVVEFEKDESAGLSLETSLDNLKFRLANPIADRFVEITRLASLSGGNGYLSALRSQALQLRLENANWNEIAVKQNWVLASAKLAVLAPWLVLVLLGMKPETGEAFQTQTGLLVLGFGLAASLLAFRLIRALGAIPERKRILGS